jgi:antitoxin component YwqK of YwqJK toxin-antitoxin module
MKILLLLSIGLLADIHCYSQTAGSADSIPLHLIPQPEPEPIIGPWEVQPIVSPQPWPGEPWAPIIYPYPIFGPISVTMWIPKCGDTHYPNGRLSSRVECINGIQHGRTIYWDERGNKTNESYYLKGKLISNKAWDQNHRMTLWENYNGANRLHGKNYTYDPETGHKVVTSYNNGMEHGKHLEYEMGKLTLCDIYHNGELIEQTKYYSSGKIMEHSVLYSSVELISEAYYENGVQWKNIVRDSSGYMISEIFRNERGIVTCSRTYKKVSRMDYGSITSMMKPGKKRPPFTRTGYPNLRLKQKTKEWFKKSFTAMVRWIL